MVISRFLEPHFSSHAAWLDSWLKAIEQRWFVDGFAAEGTGVEGGEGTGVEGGDFR